MMVAVDGLDATGTLVLVEEALLRRREAEVDDLRLAAHWADLHAADPRLGPEGRRLFPPGGNRLVEVAGEGAPLVQDLCLAELGIARRVHPLTARALVADVLDLRHRLPLTWGRVQALEAEVWVARKVAVLTRPLSATAAAVVDAAVAAAIGTQSPSRVLELAQAKVIEVDRAGHRARVEEQRRRRYVTLSRSDEYGLRLVIARVEAGDAVWVDAMLNRVADLLAARPDLRPGTPTRVGRDELRALALGWLARPAELLTLLLEAADQAPTDDVDGPETVVSTGSTTEGAAVVSTGSTTEGAAVVSTGSTTEGAAVVSTGSTTGGAPVVSTGSATGGAPVVSTGSTTGGAPVVSTGSTTEGAPVVSTGSATEGEPEEMSRTVALPARSLELLRRVDPARLAPKATLYVHLHQGAVEGTHGGVARVEGLGPLLLEQVRHLLGHTNVALKPVVDLAGRVAVDAYEHPETVKERVHLRTRGEVFPHGRATGRTVDMDHPVPYDPLGPPGQTGDHNAGPLSRTPHRAKTHLGYRVSQTGLTEYVWSTPHGLHRLVDERGTHPITAADAELLVDDLPDTADPEWDRLWDQALDQLIELHRQGRL